MTALSEAAPATNGMNRGKLYMLVATVARMGVGLITFIVLARYLGPVQFGLIATAIAYATFAGIASDFGLATYALRSAGADHKNAARIVGDALAVKILLSAAVFVACTAFFATILAPPDTLIYALIFAGALAASFADLAIVGVRAQQRFDVEAKLVVAASIAWMIVVGGVAAATQDVRASAAAFAITRFGYLVATMLTLRGWIGLPPQWRRSAAELRATLSAASAYAADSILTTLVGQIDVLIFGLILVKHDIGIYQAGSRLVQVIVPFAVILSTVYLPSMSAALATGREMEFRASAKRLMIEFNTFALVAGIGFAFVAPIATGIIYGARYDMLKSLWPGFAVFAMLRLAASSYGIQLVALGQIRPRIASHFISASAFGIAAFIALPRYGLAATSWLLALSALVTFLVLAGALIRAQRSGAVVWQGAIIVILAALSIGIVS